MESLLLKSSALSKGVIESVCQLLLKEWGSKSLGTLPGDTIQELLIEVLKFIQFLIILYLLSLPIAIFHNLNLSISSGIKFNIILLLGCESFGVGHSFGEESCPFMPRRTGEDQNGPHWF